jgi:hypothetical protein
MRSIRTTGTAAIVADEVAGGKPCGCGGKRVLVPRGRGGVDRVAEDRQGAAVPHTRATRGVSVPVVVVAIATAEAEERGLQVEARLVQAR